MKIQIVFTGRSYQTGDRLPAELEVAAGTRVSAVLRQLEESLNDDQQLPKSCLVAVSGQHIGTVSAHADRALRDGDELVLIAPVAGG